MKIEKKSVNNFILFKDIPVGGVFKDWNEVICMKFEDNCEKFNMSPTRNAINLSSGHFFLYDDEERVEFLKDAVLTY